MNKRVIYFIRILCFILLVFSLFKISNWFLSNKSNDEIISTIENSYLDKDNNTINFSKLKNINKDTIGWIKVNNTNIDYPVVKYSDNNYYLSHNFAGDYNIAGWIFMDYRNALDGNDKNLVIYGHNMRDGSMFGSLKKVLEKKWYSSSSNKYITFITDSEIIKYEVFSVYKISMEENYSQIKFKKKEFNKFINVIKKRSIYNFNVSVNNSDNILTLSTCANNNKYRVILHAKEIKNS